MTSHSIAPSSTVACRPVRRYSFPGTPADRCGATELGPVTVQVNVEPVEVNVELTKAAHETSCPICFEDYTISTEAVSKCHSVTDDTDLDVDFDVDFDALDDALTNVLNDVENVDVELGQSRANASSSSKSTAPLPDVHRVVLHPPPRHNASHDTTATCGHAFCRDCLTQHVIYAIQAKCIPIACPHTSDTPCPAYVPTPVVESILSRSTTRERYWTRYQQLVLLKDNANLLECPQCDDGIIDVTSCQYRPQNEQLVDACDKINDSSSLWGPNDLTCPSCHRTVCRVHGTAHVGMPCAQYTSTLVAPVVAPVAPHARAASLFRGRPSQPTVPEDPNPPPPDELSLRALATWTKPCSHCGCHLQKSAGCDHVICPSCRHDLCWRCGTHVHLTGQVVRHCSQCQRDYRDHRYDHVYRFRLALCLPVLIPLFMVYSMVLFAVATATGCFCGCFRCGRCLVLHTKPAPVTSPPVTATTARPRGSARLGMWATVVVVFLPVIALMEDFGFHVDILDELFPEPSNATEMPYLEVELDTL